MATVPGGQGRGGRPEAGRGVLDGTDRLFEVAERRAERLIALIRIAVAVLLGSVFVVAVGGTVPPGDVVLRRQLVVAVATLAAYFVAGLVSFLLTARGRARRRYAFAFVTLDVLFVIGSLWLNRINTGLPPNYLVVFPVVWLIPVILTFGALRYDVRLQVWVVVLLVAGVGVLALPPGAWVDALVRPAPDAVARFFAVPPNVMRLVMLLLAGLVLVVVVVRTRRLLAESLEETRRRLHLTRYLPQEVAERLLGPEGEGLRAGRRQRVVVMFVDVRDFTARAEGMDPAAIGDLLGRLRREIGAAAAAEGGVVDKFVGDDAMIVFGFPEPASDDVDRAVACGRDVLARVDALSDALEADGAPPLAVGVGLHAGEAFVGAIGDATRLEFTVVGDTVNVAARVEKATREAGVPFLATDAVAAAARDGPTWRFVDETTVRGRTAPVALYAVPAAAEDAAA